jgi:hypothetical protein
MGIEGILPIAGKALLALRNNDFSADAAIAELVDNSIQAESKNMQIRITCDKVGGKLQPVEIAFGDDGVGMNQEVLQNCLILGESTRPNDRKGIGRFGVGMTNGAISLCNKIEVYSRENKSNWHFIELNLKNVNEEGSPLITYVKEIKEFPKKYKELVGDYGTLVIWSDIDRMPSSFKTEELKYWLSRTFRKYIGDKIIQDKKIIANPNKINFSMEVIGESSKTDGLSEIHAFDPLYVIPNKNRPTDATSELLDDWTVTFAVSDIDKPEDGTKLGNITIRMSYTPQEWREEEGAGGSAENKARHIKDNEGISILRHHREVSYSKIPSWSPGFKDMDRWWSCEIDFEPVLDRQFSVTNIKVGARPTPELRKELQNEIEGTRKVKVENVREIWAAKKSKDIVDPATSKRASDAKQPRPSKPVKPISPKERKRISEELKKKKLREDEQIAILHRIEDPESPEILLQERHADVKSTDDFMEVEPMGNKTIVWMNMNHDFFQNVYSKIKQINEIGMGSTDPEKSNLVNIATELKVDIDNIIIAYVTSRNILTKLEQFDSETHENLIYHQSKALKKLYQK